MFFQALVNRHFIRISSTYQSGPGTRFYYRGNICVGKLLVKSDLRLKPVSVERTFFWNHIYGENQCLCRELETQKKVKVIVCVESFPTQTSSLHRHFLYPSWIMEEVWQNCFTATQMTFSAISWHKTIFCRKNSKPQWQTTYIIRELG